MRKIIVLFLALLILPFLLEASSEQIVNSKDNIPVDIEPVLISQPKYRVPVNYSPSDETASIFMSVLIDSQGIVKEVEIVNSNESAVINDVAIKSALEYKFEPAIRDSLPVFYWMKWEMIIDKKLLHEKSLFSATIDFDNQAPDSDDFDNRLPGADEFIPVEKLPEMIKETCPEYPRTAVEAGSQGTVWVKVLVSKNGKVVKAQIGKSSGTPSLDEAALKAAYKNLFSPAIQDGKPVNVWVTYKVNFKL